MKKAAVLIALSLFAYPLVSLADYFDDAAELELKAAKSKPVAPSVKRVDMSKYSLTELQIKKSVLRVLLARGWEIQKQTRHQITAQYKDTTIEIAIAGADVEFREVSAPHKTDYGWVSAAANNLLIEGEYYYQVNEAERIINSGAE